jgi:PEP-CTERM motif
MKFISAGLAAVVIAMATPANASLLSFELVGSRQASFTIDTETAPDFFSSSFIGEQTRFDNVAGVFAGAPGVASVSFGTFLAASLNINGIPALGFTQFAGPELFTGSGSDPVFKLGTFNLTSIVSGNSTLTISTVAAAVPEPSTWAMMIIGFAGLGFASRRRRMTLQAA